MKIVAVIGRKLNFCFPFLLRWYANRMPRVVELSRLADNPEIVSRLWIAPTIFRLSANRNAWENGTRTIELSVRATPRQHARTEALTVTWSLDRLALRVQYPTLRTELSQLRSSKNEIAITEEAALGVAFLLVSEFLPFDRITRVVQVGGRGDFYLNGRRDQMIEISGTQSGSLDTLFSRKRAQILLNSKLTKAMVSVTRFESPASRLERVR